MSFSVISSEVGAQTVGHTSVLWPRSQAAASVLPGQWPCPQGTTGGLLILSPELRKSPQSLPLRLCRDRASLPASPAPGLSVGTRGWVLQSSWVTLQGPRIQRLPHASPILLPITGAPFSDLLLATCAPHAGGPSEADSCGIAVTLLSTLGPSERPA